MKHIAILCLLLAGCASPEPPRPMTDSVAREVCDATANAPLVRAGIDQAYITFMPHTWLTQTERGLVRRMGEYSYSSRRIWTIDHREPLYHELIHRALHVTGADMRTMPGFRDEEHSLIYFYLDQKFPGLQAGRISATKRRWAAERWSRPEYQARLAELERAAIAYGGWCDGR